MKTIIHPLLIAITSVSMLAGISSQAAPPEPAGTAQPVTVRFIAYNVQFGCRGTPEEIGDMLNQWQPDLVALNEVPGGDWTTRVGKRCGMNHAYVGKISSADMMGILLPDGLTESGYTPKGKDDANFKPNKYKCILSKTPLADTREISLKGTGWQPASTVRATTNVKGNQVVVYSLHIAGGGDNPSGTQAEDLATRVLPQDAKANVVALGDFNNEVGPVMRTFEAAGFSNAWKDLNMDISGKFTFSAIKGQPGKGVIDHVLFNHPRSNSAVAAGIIELEKPLSDHKPVWCDIRFGKQAP